MSYSASSVDAISVTLTNGVQVALGSPTQIADKEKPADSDFKDAKEVTHDLQLEAKMVSDDSGGFSLSV